MKSKIHALIYKDGGHRPKCQPKRKGCLLSARWANVTCCKCLKLRK